MPLESVGLVLQVVIALFGAFFLAVWISLIIWTFRDVRSRSRDIFAQLLATLMVIIFNIPGLALYFMLRPPETLAQAYERALEEEALLQDIEERFSCPGCKRKIHADFQYCPACNTRLKRPCPSCTRLLQLHWTMCPYCGTVPAGVMEAAPVPVSAPVVKTQSRLLKKPGPTVTPARPVSSATQPIQTITGGKTVPLPEPIKGDLPAPAVYDLGVADWPRPDALSETPGMGDADE
jgi:RNA polymerase subunit RPABC4/transcription elongation factor Spt4